MKASELVLQHGTGNIYHLGIGAEHLADTILLVGDPGRVPSVSQFFDTVEFTNQNRELVYHLGRYKNHKIAVLSTGMGVDNIDIVVTELDALANIDLATGNPLPQHRSLNLIRIGTCGILQPELPLPSMIASEYGIGLDGMIYYYQTQNAQLQQDMQIEFERQMSWSPLLPRPYIVPCSTKLLSKIDNKYVRGITATAPGFYGPQGRTVRAEVLLPDLPEKLSQVSLNNHKIINLEMETSCLFSLSKILGHDAISICLGIAKRITGDFLPDYHDAMNQMIQCVLDDLVG